jgi:hypothetical protein
LPRTTVVGCRHIGPLRLTPWPPSHLGWSLAKDPTGLHVCFSSIGYPPGPWPWRKQRTDQGPVSSLNRRPEAALRYWGGRWRLRTYLSTLTDANRALSPTQPRPGSS